MSSRNVEEDKLEDEDMDDSQQAKHYDQHNAPNAVTQEDGYHMRVTKSRANELNHAKCILKLTFTKFEWSDQELLNFHRPNVQEEFYK